jgi:hypothetical protein
LRSQTAFEGGVGEVDRVRRSREAGCGRADVGEVDGGGAAAGELVGGAGVGEVQDAEAEDAVAEVWFAAGGGEPGAAVVGSGDGGAELGQGGGDAVPADEVVVSGDDGGEGSVGLRWGGEEHLGWDGVVQAVGEDPAAGEVGVGVGVEPGEPGAGEQEIGGEGAVGVGEAVEWWLGKHAMAMTAMARAGTDKHVRSRRQRGCVARTDARTAAKRADARANSVAVASGGLPPASVDS